MLSATAMSDTVLIIKILNRELHKRNDNVMHAIKRQQTWWWQREGVRELGLILEGGTWPEKFGNRWTIVTEHYIYKAS